MVSDYLSGVPHDWPCRHGRAHNLALLLCRGTSFMRNNPLLGNSTRIMSRAIWWPCGGGRVLVSEVPLYTHGRHTRCMASTTTGKDPQVLSIDTVAPLFNYCSGFNVWDYSSVAIVSPTHHSQPRTINPNPSTLNPQLYSVSPELYARNSEP